MSDEHWLDPAAARARFGELRHAGTYQHFSELAGGEWRPELGPGLVLKGYRLHRELRVPHVRAPFRPAGR